MKKKNSAYENLFRENPFLMKHHIPAVLKRNITVSDANLRASTRSQLNNQFTFSKTLFFTPLWGNQLASAVAIRHEAARCRFGIRSPGSRAGSPVF